jgi:hypothetical protein
MHRFLVSYLGLTSLIASSVLSHETVLPVAHSGCGTAAPSEPLKSAYRNLLDVNGFDSQRQSNSSIYVDTWFHVVSSNASSRVVTEDMLKSQVSYISFPCKNTSHESSDSLSLIEIFSLPIFKLHMPIPTSHIDSWGSTES